MHRSAFAGVLAGVSLATLVCLSASQDKQKPAFRSGVDLVVVAADVTDHDGNVILGLEKDDFEIREDGRPVNIATFVPIETTAEGDREHPSDEPRFIVLLLDDLVGGQERAWRVKEIARMFASRMGPHDVMAVMRVNGSAHTTTNRREEVLAAIDRFTQAPKSLMPLPYLSEHFLDTIADLGRQLADVPHRRKMLVCIGSAGVFNPTERGLFGGVRTASPEWRNAIRETTVANVSVYVIDPAGFTGATARYDGVYGFVGETGGYAFVNTNFFERAVDRVWQQAGVYYVLGYQPPKVDGKLHSIRVEAKRPGARVQARRARG